VQCGQTSRSDSSSAHQLSTSGRSCARRRSRVTSCTVRPPLPHQSTASRTDRPSSSVILRSASPARLSASRTLRRVHRVRSARRPLNPRAGDPGRRVLSAVLLGHPTPTVALPASPPADSPITLQSRSIPCHQLKAVHASSAINRPNRISATYPHPIPRIRCATHLMHRR